MQQVDAAVSFLVANEATQEAYESLPARPVFDGQVLDFLDAFAGMVLNDKACRQYPDVLTLGFWCRKALLAKQREKYSDGGTRLGRGLVFHIAPSNLPIAFGYSLVAGLLSGNANVVRVPSSPFPQVAYVCSRLQALLERPEYESLRPYLACVRYNYDQTALTEYFSSLCDVRVIWGGDSTLSRIRKAGLKPGAFEIVFSDRYSLCVIDGDAWLQCKDKHRQIRGFYNDTYLNDQNACSAPHFVLWLGDHVDEARVDFWRLLEEKVKQEYRLHGVQSILKLEAFHRMVEKFPGLRLCSDNNYLVRVWAPDIEPELMAYRPGSGFFVESRAGDISALAPLLGRKCQTLSYYGVQPAAFSTFLHQLKPRGIDRIVPVGHTLDFSLTWDGHDLIRTLSRKIEIVQTHNHQTYAI